MEKFHDIYTALITPYDAVGKLNLQGLRQLIEMQISDGVSGFFITGTTSEVFLLTNDERKSIVSEVIKIVGGRVGVIAQISFISLEETIEMAKFAEANGADGISVLPPLYFRYSPAQIVDYYCQVCGCVSIPVFIYDIPCCTGMYLLDKEYRGIFSLPNVVGVKCSHQNQEKMKELLTDFPDMKIFIGSDEIFLDALKLGAVGAVGSTYNIIPHEFNEMIDAFKSGDYEKARKIQSIANEFMSKLNSMGGTPAVKAVLNKMGVSCGECRSPFKKLSDSEKTEAYVAYLSAKEQFGKVI